MAEPPPVRIAGVPEAFNDPFDHIPPAAPGAPGAPQFVVTPGGSGAMTSSLLSGAVDAAFMLTECVVAAARGAGAPLRLAGPLVRSPLSWAVVVSATSATASIADLGDGGKAVRWGVSRLGSGSHVMARLEAANRGWPSHAQHFVVCSNLAGLTDNLLAGRIDAFLWEHFTTKHLADQGSVRFVGHVPTPWPCFAVAVRADTTQQRMQHIRAAVDAFLDAAHKWLAHPAAAAHAVTRKHRMTTDDAAAWVAAVRYASPGEHDVDPDTLQRIEAALVGAGVISPKADPTA